MLIQKLWQSFFDRYFVVALQVLNSEVGKTYEEFRIDGYNDAVLALERASKRLTPAEMQEWRVTSYRGIQETPKTLHAIVKVFTFSAILEKIGLILAMTAFPIVLFSQSLAFDVVVLVLFGVFRLFQNWIINMLNDSCSSVYYTHGFHEGIISLSDPENLINIEKLRKRPLHSK